MNQKITFIGGGNMANSIIGGLIAQGFDPQNICACDPLPETRAKLEQTFGVTSSSDNGAAAARADAVILAVKPQIMQSVCEQLQSSLKHKPLIISIAAGIPLAKLTAWLGGDLAIIRCMPNTPALVQAGASSAYANLQCSPEQHTLAETILRSVGIVEWLEDEALIDAVTAISGSGP